VPRYVLEPEVRYVLEPEPKVRYVLEPEPKKEEKKKEEPQALERLRTLGRTVFKPVTESDTARTLSDATGYISTMRSIGNVALLRALNDLGDTLGRTVKTAGDAIGRIPLVRDVVEGNERRRRPIRLDPETIRLLHLKPVGENEYSYGGGYTVQLVRETPSSELVGRVFDPDGNPVTTTPLETLADIFSLIIPSSALSRIPRVGPARAPGLGSAGNAARTAQSPMALPAQAGSRTLPPQAGPRTLPPQAGPRALPPQAGPRALPAPQKIPTPLDSDPRIVPTASSGIKGPRPELEVPRGTDGNPVRIVFPMGGGAPQQTASVVNDYRTILNRALGNGLGDGLARVRQIEEPLRGSRFQELRQGGLLKLSAAEDLNLLRVLENRAPALSARVSNLAQSFKKFAAEDAAAYIAQKAHVLQDAVYGTDSGARIRRLKWSPFQPVENYAPRGIDPVKVVKLQPEDLGRALMNANPWMNATQAGEYAAGLRAQAYRQPLPSSVGEEVARVLRGRLNAPSHLHSRTKLTIPDEIIQPMREALPNYVRDAARERAVLATYGPKDAAIEGALSQAFSRDPGQARLAMDVWDRFRNRAIGGPAEGAARQVGAIMGNVASGTLLGINTAVKQASQIVPTFAKLKARSLGHGLVKMFTREGVLDAERMGAFVDDLAHDAYTMMQRNPGATRLDRVQKATGNFASFVVQKSGIKWADQFFRGVTFHAARHDLSELRVAALNGNQGALNRLQKFGLNAAATTDEIASTAKSLADRFNIRADAQDLPYIFSTPAGQFSRQLNSFNIGMTRLMWTDFIRPAVRNGDVMPLLKLLFGGTIVGEGVATVVRTIQGREEDRPGGSIREFIMDITRGNTPARTTVARVLDNLAWAGTFGYLQAIKEAAIASSPMEMQTRLASTVIGAGAASGIEGLSQVVNPLTKAVTGDIEGAVEGAQSSARSLVRRTPIIGSAIAARFVPSVPQDRRRALAAIERAIRRKDEAEVGRWLEWFFSRTGKEISSKAIGKAAEQAGQR